MLHFVVVFGFVVEVPAWAGGGEAVRVFGAEAEGGHAAGGGGAQEEAAEEGGGVG